MILFKPKVNVETLQKEFVADKSADIQVRIDRLSTLNAMVEQSEQLALNARYQEQLKNAKEKYVAAKKLQKDLRNLKRFHKGKFYQDYRLHTATRF